MVTNLEILIKTPDAAFIFRSHDTLKKDGSFYRPGFHYTEHFYHHLLHTNTIGNPSTVIYRRATLEKFPFNTSTLIKGCEDYDHYLSIARELLIIINPITVSIYRQHEDNMSNNYAMMLNSALNVMLRHKPFLRNREENQEWKNGWYEWVYFYGYFPVRSNNKLQLTQAHLGLIKNTIFICHGPFGRRSRLSRAKATHR
jgi:hypothetical protein